jgi:hypothetical protein
MFAWCGITIAGSAADAPRHLQEILISAVGVEVCGDDAMRFRRLQYDGTGTVAEEDAGAAVLPVEDAGHGLRSHDQRAAGRAGADELVGDADGIDEPGANGLDIEGRTSVDIEALLQQAGGGRKDLIRRRSRQHDQIDVGGSETGCLKRAPGGCLRQVATGFPRGHDVAFADPGTLLYPLIGGIDDLLEIEVRHDAGR